MSFLGLFGSSGDVVGSISFGFRADFENSYLVSVRERGAIPEGLENWIWDLFYSKALYTIGKSQISDGLKHQLEMWAEEHSAPLLAGMPVPMELTRTIDPDLQITYSAPSADEEVYELDIIQPSPSRRNPEAWPLIDTRLPRRGFQNRFASAVLILTQHIMSKNSFFTRMLPLHILSMRKFYQRNADYSSIRSVIGAPAFAIEEEKNWHSNVQPRVLEGWKEWQRDANS